MLKGLLLFVLLSPLWSAHAQTSVVIGGGYQLPTNLAVAPGQVLTLFATGIGKRLSDRPVRTSAPFPTTAAGISVMVTPGNGGGPLSAPILAAVLTDTCHSEKAPCAGVKIAAITVQIPFELPTVPDITGPPGMPQTPDTRVITPAQAVIKITEDGASTTEMSVNVFESQVHFIQGHHELALDLIDGLSAGASVFHADGNPVSPNLPARMGETLVVYGYGFGRPHRTLRTGEVAAEAIPVPMYGNIQFSILLPDQPLILDASSHPASRYISYFGVTPNAVGVYQMNFVVPSIGPGFRRCDTSTTANFTVTYTEGVANSSFAFCVEP